MPIIRDYLEKGAGNFLTAKNTRVGATVTIQSVRLDDETFDKSYIVVTGEYDETGEECNVRLGVQNLKRIAEVLGDDEATWPGQKLKIIGYQDYPGLGQRGILWTGERVVQGSSPGVDVVIQKILQARPDLTLDAVRELLRKEKEKAAGLLTDEAAAHLVASNLGIDLK
ncbi:MAG: hypothetical protein JRD89_01300 [Deltaproteobacteria bacterium]|nr:hypothetical protein [Deltaproteobacteria bacterium]